MPICPKCPAYDDHGLWLQFDFEADWPYVNTIFYCEHCDYLESYIIDILEISSNPEKYARICYKEEEE